MNWTHGEKGPECYCGMPTGVVVSEDGKRADLLCIFHTNEAGAMFPLPAERPANWPELSEEDLTKCMVQGQAEDDAKEDEDE
jgi:hypothetical protein